MPVVMLIDNPDGSQEVYDALRAKLQFDSPLGGTAHIAGPGPNGGWRVIEVWESAEAASQFLTERFAPALAELGFDGRPPEPQFWPVHECLVNSTAVR